MKRKTVFVLGAGASNEFDLPLGSGLQSWISSAMDMRFQAGRQESGDREIYDTVKRRFRERPLRIPESAWLIRDGVKLTDSIDNFLEKHSHDKTVQLLGKLAIAKCIIEAERGSSLFVNRDSAQNSLDMSRIENTWIVPLFKHLQRGVKAENIDSILSGVSFIVFNYDRCLEHFLIWAIMLSHGCSEPRAAEAVSSANIFHPYGSLGLLPHIAQRGETSVSFGAEDYDLLEIAQRIKTYGEQATNTEEHIKAKDWVHNADQIVFLGFGFHPQNLALLEAPSKKGRRMVIGTAYKESPFNNERIGEKLRAMFNPTHRDWQPNLVDKTSLATIQEFARAFE